MCFSKHEVLTGDGEDDVELMVKEIEETTHSTKAALEKIVNLTIPMYASYSHDSNKFIKYKPLRGKNERIIKMVSSPVDPLEPSKFKCKKVPKPSGYPPVPVMHSPPRPLTVKDQEDWRVPPCISNSKNPKGYTIPLDKRVVVDGRRLLQDVQISNDFAKFSEALYVAEQKASEAVGMRSKVHEEILFKEKERKEKGLRELAQRAQSERTGGVPPPVAIPVPTDHNNMSDDGGEMKEQGREFPRGVRVESVERKQREKVREDRRRERKRKRNLEAKYAAMGKKSKTSRDRNRDVSEKVALGMASTEARHGGGKVMYDQRLFNQDKGMDSGFTNDDRYNVYDKGLFTAQSTHSSLYRPRRNTDSEMYGGDDDEQLEKVLKTNRFKPDKGFSGATEKAGPRERPVEFDELTEEADPFGLDLYIKEVNKKAMEKLGSGGTMEASAGGSLMRDGIDGGSGRTRIGFERG